MAKVVTDITLHYLGGNSDKIYYVSIEEEPLGCYHVMFEFGRRCTALRRDTKTVKPVFLPEAQSIFADLVNAKKAKGYKQIGKDTRVNQSNAPLNIPVVPAQPPVQAEPETTANVQLLNPIDEKEAERYLSDNEYWMQEKFDGKRIRLHYDVGKVKIFNKKGKEIMCPADLEEGAKRLSVLWTECQLDGEMIGKNYYVFDIMSFCGNNLENNPYEERYDFLQQRTLPKGMILAPCYVNEEEKREAYNLFKKNKKEGVVFKKCTAPYVYGRPASGGDQVKCKFWASASCVVTEQNGNKRSVGLMLFENGKPVFVGKVTIPPNFDIPSKGDIVEVKYLYATSAKQLYQSIYLGKRDDVDASECVTGQLKFKGMEEDN